MNKYDPLMQKIVTWAQQIDNIRALVVIGSRARATNPADEWSDLDLLVLARDVTPYIESADWLHHFGAPLLTFTEPTFDGAYERRALFAGFLDVDFALETPDSLQHSLQIGEVRGIFQRGYHILLDKDEWTAVLAHLDPAPPHQPLSPAQISNDIHDYWYHVVWTAKKLQRGELWTAMNCLNCYMKQKLLRMIETHTALFAEGEVDTWHNGRLLEKWAAPAITESLPGCFADYDPQSISAALNHQMTLYHDLATQVADTLDLAYPTQSVQTVREWI